MGEKNKQYNIEPKALRIKKNLIVSMSRLNKIIAIKLAGHPERLVGLSDLGSNLSCMTTWVGYVLLSPVLRDYPHPSPLPQCYSECEGIACVVVRIIPPPPNYPPSPPCYSECEGIACVVVRIIPPPPNYPPSPPCYSECEGIACVVVRIIPPTKLSPPLPPCYSECEGIACVVVRIIPPPHQIIPPPPMLLSV